MSQSIRVLSAVVAREPREPTEAEILASSTWQQINDRIEPALKPYPEAARAMMKALEGCK